MEKNAEMAFNSGVLASDSSNQLFHVVVYDL